MNRLVPCLVLAWLASCGPKVPADEPGGGRLADTGGGESGDEGGGGGGVGGDVGRAIDDAKRGLEELDARIAKAREEMGNDAAEVEAVVAMAHDRTALVSFIADLQRCAADGEDACPPKLEEPVVPGEFDAASGELKGAFAADAAAWPEAAAVIAANACACRTRVCVDWVMAELERWETALSADEMDAEGAGASETTARSCIHRRLGR